LWSTLYALLFKPGLLTREFLDGRRVRYLPPLRLYLVLSVVFFLIISNFHPDARVVSVDDTDGKKSFSAGSLNGPGSPYAAKSGETPQQRSDRLCKPDYDGPASRFVTPLLEKTCRESLENNGQRIYDAMMHNLSRALFIFLPALAVLMKLLYRRPPRYYIEHLLFFVHMHAFAFLLFGVLALLSWIVPAALKDSLNSLFWLYSAGYLLVAMRRVYGQEWGRTVTKFVALSFAYLLGGALVMMMTVTYSIYEL
jgi:hypothetical protein